MQYSFCRDVSNTADYLGLVIVMWAILGSCFVPILIFYPILGLIMGKYCVFVIFHNPSLGLKKINTPLLVDSKVF